MRKGGRVDVAMWIVIVGIAVIAPPFTLLWWRQADKWADAEHKRFKVKVDTRERVVVGDGEERGGGGGTK
jgi:hypothetical protein